LGRWLLNLARPTRIAQRRNFDPRTTNPPSLRAP
jgi:hypothetical protein